MTSKVQKLTSFLKYQEGTIVSKTLINKDTGTITIFAFAKDQALSEHTAPFDALLQVIDGKAEVTISGEKYEIVTGEMILMPANKPHAVKAIERFKMMLFMIKE
jgi:quercetin dioxygenase-like cupin family protein